MEEIRPGEATRLVQSICCALQPRDAYKRLDSFSFFL